MAFVLESIYSNHHLSSKLAYYVQRNVLLFQFWTWTKAALTIWSEEDKSIRSKTCIDLRSFPFRIMIEESNSSCLPSCHMMVSIFLEYLPNIILELINRTSKRIKWWSRMCLKKKWLIQSKYSWGNSLDSY